MSLLALALAACGGSNTNNNGDGGPGDALSNDGPCTPGSQRCNGNDSQTCNADGTHWETTETCATFCSEGVCALESLEVAADEQRDGTIVVAGPVIIRAGATLSSPAGDLTIFADTLTIEAGATIAAAPTGATPDGKGSDAACSSCGTGGGFYINGSSTDSIVGPGSEGGRVFQSTTVAVAKGGGVIRLIVKGTAQIDGQITAIGANGGSEPNVCKTGGGGGSGGGILVLADELLVTGSLSTAGGLGGVGGGGGCSTLLGGAGGEGAVKLLSGAKYENTGSVVGTKTEGLAPPVPVKSFSHPDSTKIYNDGFLSLDIEWKKPFPSAMGYFVRLDQTPSRPPTAADGQFLSTEKVSFSPNDIFDGENYVHVVSVDAQSAIGRVESVFKVQINTQGPSISSSSHPSQSTFVNNTNPFFQWSYPQGDDSVSAVYYVLDSFGDTVPTTSDTTLPPTQKQLLLPSVTAGVHVLHVVAADGQGRLTKQAGHYRINVGADPGVGAIQGQVVDANNMPVVGATVTVNRGLFTTTTTTSGTYSLPSVTAGVWELSAKSAAQSASKQITVTAGMSVNGNLTLQ
ncbi:MAG TPA: carboxypeptidase-like regulatory domain-containing protein [Kofleriaceae bacterium]|nr:carboxypeptidase-like regulatory domain-containing protein [Kofleriaceae bacterium]